MRDEERVYLPSKLSEKWNELELDVFEKLADGVTRGKRSLLLCD